MTVYAQVKDEVVLKFPYTLGDLMEENPFTRFSFDTDLAEVFPSTQLAQENSLTLVEVEFLPEPSFDERTQKIERKASPELIDGAWKSGFNIIDKTASEIAIDNEAKAETLRQQRNQLLRDSDFSQLPDATVDKTLWAAYRQQLRDLTSQPGFPWTVTWPLEP